MEHHNLFDQSQIEQIIRRLQQIENKLDVLISGLGQTTKPNPNTKWADNPQAVEIDALIERAGQLTDNEANSLNLARYSARYAARLTAISDGAARHTAYAAARHTAGNAARLTAGAGYDSARYAAWNTAGTGYNGAGHAASALVVRDLIDEETLWNQAAYDTLTGPWPEVIGPVHPDDVTS